MKKFRPPQQKRKIITASFIAVILVSILTPTFAGVYKVAGPSMAPSLFWNDLVLVNKGAYDVHLPFTFKRVFKWSNPEIGDIVLFQVPHESYIAFKRVVAGPGDRIEMRGNRLLVNGIAAEYTAFDSSLLASVADSNKLGQRMEEERFGSQTRIITYTPGKKDNFGEVRVPDGDYFLLGDNRDNSNDSRYFGPLPREQIVGKMCLVLKSAKPIGGQTH